MSVDEIDRSLVEFAQKIVAMPKGIANEGGFEEPSPGDASAASPAAAELGGQNLPPPLPANKQSDPDIRPALSAGAIGKQLHTADEIAGLIMKSLRVIEDCPRRGFVVTVYGSNPWNAMLTIRPEAGPRIDRELWRSRVQDIGMRLSDEFDMADASTISTNVSA
ncbi:hypothetical protein [Bradyrhizobium icense]|uniref:Uncharacterized protein n=1 Tax=Bradyrhizobium icense TaxID=1274631 RepID=A0A1B1UCB9_9BRAD|nr:hypothetical protein [Bradyrhizobium icense]ANW00412.1 hypothetical protein LMTR13_09790 [Bradyrhizobium icense]